MRPTIRSLMVAVAFIAIALHDVRLSTLLLLLTGAVVSLRCPTRATLPYFVALGCLYLPFSWLILMSGPWDGYRWHWIKLWPILPGLPAGVLLHPNDRAENLVSGMAAVVLVALVTWAGAGGRKALILAAGVALVVAILVSWLAYRLFVF